MKPADPRIEPHAAGLPDVTLVLRCTEFVARAHQHQRRKGTSERPYVNHLIEVARLIAEVGGVTDDVVLCAALLHDVVEDTPVTQADVEAAFGPDVASVVAEVTDDKSLPKQVRKRLQVEHAPLVSYRAALVKLADKISNVRDLVSDPPGTWDTVRLRTYVDWAHEVVSALPVVNAPLLELFEATCIEARAAIGR